MSLLQKLNPLHWIKELLISDYVGGALRQGLTALGTWLVANAGAPQSFADLLLSPDFIGGILSILISIAASVANKRAV